MSRATKRQVEIAHESFDWVAAQWHATKRELEMLRRERDEAIQQRDDKGSLLVTAHEAWQEAEQMVAERDAEIKRLRDGLKEIVDMFPHDAEVATLDQIHWIALRVLYPVTETPAGPMTDEELTRRAEIERLRDALEDVIESWSVHNAAVVAARALGRDNVKELAEGAAKSADEIVSQRDEIKRLKAEVEGLVRRAREAEEDGGRLQTRVLRYREALRTIKDITHPVNDDMRNVIHDVRNVVNEALSPHMGEGPFDPPLRANK